MNTSVASNWNWDITQASSMATAVPDADWVLPAEPGMFWWPRGGDITEVLAAVPARYGIVGSVLRDLTDETSPPREGPTARRLGSERLLRLHGWRPFEVFRAGSGPGDLDNARDSPLAGALRALEGGGRLAFPRPDIVAEAAYALEVAGLEQGGPLDLLDQLGALERRVATLERRAWPRVAARLAKRGRP